jgi:hypothetical protein
MHRMKHHDTISSTVILLYTPSRETTLYKYVYYIHPKHADPAFTQKITSAVSQYFNVLIHYLYYITNK